MDQLFFLRPALTRALLIGALLLGLSACSLPVFFRVPVVQGNIVTAKKVNQLKKGMSKRQVEYVMGTPLVNSSFGDNRWDYVFYYRDPRAHVRHSDINLYFTNNKLATIEGAEQYRSRAQNASVNPPLGDEPLPTGITPGPNNRTTPRQLPVTPTTTPRPSEAIPGPDKGPPPAAAAPTPDTRPIRPTVPSRPTDRPLSTGPRQGPPTGKPR